MIILHITNQTKAIFQNINKLLNYIWDSRRGKAVNSLESKNVGKKKGRKCVANKVWIICKKNANPSCVFLMKYDDNILKENILKLHIFKA